MTKKGILRCGPHGVQGMNDFTLHPQLQKDTTTIGCFPLSLLLLHRDANYPWFILVPQRAGVTEVYHLNEADRAQLLHESCQLAEALTTVFVPDKLNIATIGNIVPQLHMHHVARFKDDAAWPGPIWGAMPAIDYEPSEQVNRTQGVVNVLVGEEFKVY